MEQNQQTELYLKELNDARLKAGRYGLPFYLFRGRIYATEGPSKALAEATEHAQMLWDALA
jgi:hypothetical protein